MNRPLQRDRRSENPNGIPPQSPGLPHPCSQGRGYPGLAFEKTTTPTRVAPHSRISNGRTGTPDGGTTPLGLILTTSVTQGSSFLATLGWRTQSRWDWESPASASQSSPDENLALRPVDGCLTKLENQSKIKIVHKPNGRSALARAR